MTANAAPSGPVYRCEQAGQVIYRDQPCATNAASPSPPSAAATQPATGTAASPTLSLPPLNTMAPPSAAQTRQAREADRAAAAAARAHQQADAQWLRDYQARQQHEAAIRQGVIEDRVVLGMSKDQVERILNLPNQTESLGDGRERWVYNSAEGRRLITFKNGTVVADNRATAQKSHHVRKSR